MKRLRRILFNTLTAISLLLAIATAGLWVRSYFASDICFIERRVDSVPQERCYWMQSFRGRLYVDTTWRDRSTHAPSIVLRSDAPEDMVPLEYGWVVSYETFYARKVDSLPSRFSVSAPYWLLLLGFLLPPIGLGFARFRQIQRHKKLLCPACGYDTRANPAKCSECGHEVKAKAAGDGGDVRG